MCYRDTVCILQRNIDSIAFYHQSLYKTTSERVIERLGEPAMKALDCDSVCLEKVIVRDLIEKKKDLLLLCFTIVTPFFRWLVSFGIASTRYKDGGSQYCSLY